MEKMPHLNKAQSVQRPSSGEDTLAKQFSDLLDLAVHDLDAPLRKLSLFVGLLTNKMPTDNETKSTIGRVTGCIDDMRSLIDDLSVLGKLDNQTLNIGSCSIDQVVQDALQEMPAAIKEKQAVITTLSLPVIEGDPEQLRLLFQKLVENAIIFSKKEKVPEISIDADVLSPQEKDEFGLIGPGLYYKIRINDNGIGFKNENAGRLFHPFVRLHGKSQYPGNGIGLAICRKIADIHRGIIYAEGRENEGARFVLILPESHQ
jgi:light-regulated signal transduction histidine kinase (bacteriophytochrome)